MNSNDPKSQGQVPFHTLSEEEVLKRLETRKDGLSSGEAAKLLEQYGKNVLQEAKPNLC